jgi:acetyl esterase/lipase
MNLPKVVLIALFALSAFLFVDAPRALSAEPRVELLWPSGAPGAVGNEDADRPSLTIYPAPEEKAVGAGIVICPGGGYGHLAVDHEGDQIAKWMNSMGVTAGVLRYRIAPRYHHPTPMLDVQRAMRLMRSRAEELQIDPAKIGVIGFSAGGHLASTAATHFDAGDTSATDPVDQVSCRPDFAILGYPVITMELPVTHGGSRRNLLGENPDAELVALMSNDQQVRAETPPTFLMHTTEDTAVLPANSLLFYDALCKAGVPAELHIYEKGPHGVGLARDIPGVNSWPERCEVWLRGRGVLPEAK